MVVRGLGNVKQLALGSGHTCALLFDGTVQCWGGDGLRGDGAPFSDPPSLKKSRPTAAPVPGLSSVVQVTATDGHTCALLADGSLFCWGSNRYGQLGDGTTIDRLVPTEITW